MASVIPDPSSVPESAFVVRGEVPIETIAASLQALLATRRHPIAPRRFTLLDTFDGRVRRAGARLTRGGVAASPTVDWQSRHGRHVSAQVKRAPRFAWDLPDGPLAREVAPVVGVRRLFAKAEAEEHGSLIEVLDGEGKTVARLRIASGRARLPVSRSAWQPLPTVVTLSALRGYEDDYARLVPLILSRPGVERCPEGLDGVILGRLGVREPRDVGSLRLEVPPAVRADAGARQIQRAIADVLVANEAGVRERLDTEFLHDFRVAVRRTRSLLGQIREVFPPDDVARFASEFSWMGRLTGPPRDLDVLLLALRGAIDGVEARDLRALTTVLEEARQREQVRLEEALASDRYRRLIDDWTAFLDRGPDASDTSGAPPAPNAARPLVDVVSDRAWRLSRRVARSVVDARSPAAELHAVRIAAKKLRYLVDVTPAFYEAADLERILDALKRLQRVLGDFNDAEVQERRLLGCADALAGAGVRPSALVALGRLAERCRERRERVRGQIVEGLARFRDRDTRSALRRAFRVVGSEGLRG
jgi:CHAD domain-containing protein